ncbi:MAG: hypothetical protein R3F40_10390 [Candidatus Competibacteraceae bacterium]
MSHRPWCRRLPNERLNDSDANVRESALDGLLALERRPALCSSRGAFERGSADPLRGIRLGRQRLSATPEGQLLGQALNEKPTRSAALGRSAHPALAAHLHTGGGYIAKCWTNPGARGRRKRGHTQRSGRKELEPLFSTALVCRQPDMALQSVLCLSWLGDDRASGALLQLSRRTGGRDTAAGRPFHVQRSSI